MKVKSESEVTQSCPTSSDPMDCSPPGSSIHGTLQARVLEWGAIAFSDSTVWLLLNIRRSSLIVVNTLSRELYDFKCQLREGRASLVAQTVTSLSVMQKTWFWSLGWEDPLEKEMANHSSILVWRIPWTGAPGRFQFMGLYWVRHDWTTNTFISQGKGG